MSGAREPEALRERLARRVGQIDDLRPFVCDGSPLGCEVFIAGTSPVTRLRSPFWSFWDPGYGFRKPAWLAACRAEARSASGERRAELSNTRRVIEWIGDGLRPLHWLETQVLATPGPAGAVSEADARVALCFDVLVQEIRPRALVVHGNAARLYLEARLRTRLTPWQIARPRVRGEGMIALAVPHLARHWSRHKALEAARLVRDALSA